MDPDPELDGQWGEHAPLEVGPRPGYWYTIAIALGAWAAVIAIVIGIASLVGLIAGCSQAAPQAARISESTDVPYIGTSAPAAERAAQPEAIAAQAVQATAAPAAPLLVSYAWCTGVPIGPFDVVTAAHARFGPLQPGESVTQPGKGIGLVARIQHPTLDLQILKLESPLSRWSAVSFAPVVVNQPLKFAGCAQCAWGAPERWEDAGVIIDGVTSIIFGGVSGIQGDSGGGLFVMDGAQAGPAAGSSSTPRLKLVGTIINPNGAVRLSAAEGWIREQLRQSPDFNLDGVVSVQDLNDYIKSWLERKDAPVQDWLDFVTAWQAASAAQAVTR